MNRIATAGCLIGLALLGACTGVVPVKTVMADKPAYLSKNFSITSLDPALVSQVESADVQPLGFRKMVLMVSVHQLNATADNSQRVIKEVLTLNNAGGPFVQRLEEITSNDLVVNDIFALTYRGLMQVRSQDVPVNAVQSNAIFQVRSFPKFTVLPTVAEGGQADYLMISGPVVQAFNLPQIGAKCSAGGHTAASTINSALGGDARKYHCQYINDAGVPTQTFDFAYLEKYGVGVYTHFETAVAGFDYEFTKAEIE